MQVIRYSLISSLLAGSVLVSAQSNNSSTPVVPTNISLSDGCSNTLKQLVLSPDGGCLNLSGLLSFAALGDNDSIIPPINLWLKGVCSVGKCSDESLTNLMNTVLSGCRQDLVQYANLTPDHDDEVKKLVLQVYPVARESLCLVDGATNELCVTETLTNLQNVTGTLSYQQINPTSIIQEGQNLTTPALTGLLCTPCLKQTYNVVNKAFPDYVSPITGPAKNLCGASFVDGADGANVKTSAPDTQFLASAKSGNGALQSVYNSWVLFLGGALTLLL